MIDISDQVRFFLQSHDLSGSRLLVGFSGGADSTALLLALLAAGGEGVSAVHCHHGLRGADAMPTPRGAGLFVSNAALLFVWSTSMFLANA